jgi:hypothetical protein
MIKNRNEITGDKIQTKGVFSKEAEDRFDLIFRKKEPTERNPDPDWDEGRIDVIGSNGNDGLHYENTCIHLDTKDTVASSHK